MIIAINALIGAPTLLVWGRGFSDAEAEASASGFTGILEGQDWPFYCSMFVLGRRVAEYSAFLRQEEAEEEAEDAFFSAREAEFYRVELRLSGARR